MSDRKCNLQTNIGKASIDYMVGLPQGQVYSILGSNLVCNAKKHNGPQRTTPVRSNTTGDTASQARIHSKKPTIEHLTSTRDQTVTTSSSFCTTTTSSPHRSRSRKKLTTKIPPTDRSNDVNTFTPSSAQPKLQLKELVSSRWCAKYLDMG